MEDQEDLSYEEILKSLDNFKDDMESEFGISLDETSDEKEEEKDKTVSTQKQLEHIDQLLINLQYKQKEWENKMNNFTFDNVQQYQFKLPSKSDQDNQLKDNDGLNISENNNSDEKLSDLEFKKLPTEEKARKLLSDLDSSFIIEIDEVHLFNKLSTSGHFDEGEDISKAIQIIKNERLNAINNIQTLEEVQIAMENDKQSEIEEQQVKLYEERYIQLQEQRQMLEEQKALLQDLKEKATQEEERIQIEERQKKIDDQIQKQEEQLQDHTEKEKHIENIKEKLKREQEERQRNFEERKKLWQKSVQERTRINPESPSSSFISNSPDSLLGRKDSLKRIFRRSMASIKNIKTESSPNKFKVSQKELIKPSKDYIQSIIQKIIPHPNLGRNELNSHLQNENSSSPYIIVHREISDSNESEQKGSNTHDDSQLSENKDSIEEKESIVNDDTQLSEIKDSNEQKESNVSDDSQLNNDNDSNEQKQTDVTDNIIKEESLNISVDQEHTDETPIQEHVNETNIQHDHNNSEEIQVTETQTSNDEQVSHHKDKTNDSSISEDTIHEVLDSAINTLDSLDTIQENVNETNIQQHHNNNEEIPTTETQTSNDDQVSHKDKTNESNKSEDTIHDVLDSAINTLDSLDILTESKEVKIEDYFKNEQESRDFLNQIINSEMDLETLGGITQTTSNDQTLELIEGMDAVLDSFLKNSE